MLAVVGRGHLNFIQGDSGTLFGVSQSLILYDLSPFEDFFLQGASTASFILIPIDILIDVSGSTCQVRNSFLGVSVLLSVAKGDLSILSTLALQCFHNEFQCTRSSET